MYGRSIGQDLLNVPMGDMITQMALAIAEAQLALDESGIRQAELMSGQVAIRDDEGQLIDDDGNPTTDPSFIPSTVFFGYHKKGDEYVAERVSMMELGFTPTFYQFIDTVIEVKIAIKMSRERTNDRDKQTAKRSAWSGRSRTGRTRAYSANVVTVDARYSSTYSYSAEGSSLLRTKLVPVPPPSILEERARMLMEQNEKDREADREAARNADGGSTNG